MPILFIAVRQHIKQTNIYVDSLLTLTNTVKSISSDLGSCHGTNFQLEMCPCNVYVCVCVQVHVCASCVCKHKQICWIAETMGVF